MALAPYFGKAALSAVSLMQDVTFDVLRDMVKPLHVTVAIGADAVQSNEGRVILDLTTNLLSRFYPALQFLTCDPTGEEYAAKLREASVRINPEIEFLSGAPITACIAVGTVSPSAQCCVFLGSDQWVAHVSTQSERTLGGSSNPFGAAAAACIGAAFVFRHFFHEHLGVPAPAEEFSLSLATYERNAQDSSPPVDIDLGEIGLVGIGAIGNAAVWALGKTQASGTLHLIDYQLVDDTNPQRYILTTAGCPGKHKIDIAIEYLEGSRLTPIPQRVDWAGFITKSDYRAPRLVACALDTAEDRCAVQSSLPEFLLNAWTQRGDLGVSRHEFLGGSACLACLYWPRSSHQNLDELVMQAIRYSGELMDVRNMIYLRTPLDDGWLDRIAADMEVDRAALEPFRNKTLDELYREGVCGGQIVAVKGTNIEVPMAFQSAFAGIMLAAEIVKNASGPGIRDELVTTKIDLLRPLGTRLSEKANKPQDISCICRDEVYVKRYLAKHPHWASEVGQRYETKRLEKTYESE